MRTPEAIVATEVLCCASRLVMILAESSSIDAIVGQARSLFCPARQVEREVLEHWIVSDWLAERLAQRGETVDQDFAGLTIWGRTTTGQPIECDDVIIDVAR
jgi:hypothetical protein